MRELGASMKACFPAPLCFPTRSTPVPPRVLYSRFPAKAGAQEPRWRRCHETDLSAANIPPAGCSGSCPLSFPPRKRGPRSRDGAAVTERTSVQRAFCQHDAQALLKESTLRAAEAVVVRCPLGCRPELGGPWVPAFAGKTRGRIARGSGAALVPRSRSRPQRSELSAGTVLERS